MKKLFIISLILTCFLNFLSCKEKEKSLMEKYMLKNEHIFLSGDDLFALATDEYGSFYLYHRDSYDYKVEIYTKLINIEKTVLTKLIEKDNAWKYILNRDKGTFNDYKLYGEQGLYFFKTKNSEWFLFNEEWKVIDISDEIFE